MAASLPSFSRRYNLNEQLITRRQLMPGSRPSLGDDLEVISLFACGSLASDVEG